MKHSPDQGGGDGDGDGDDADDADDGGDADDYDQNISLTLLTRVGSKTRNT